MKRMPAQEWLAYALAAMLLFSAANVVLKVITSRKEAAALDLQAVGAVVGVALIALTVAYFLGYLKISSSLLQIVLLFVVLSSAGFALMLKAYETGKVALVTAVLALSTVAVAILSYSFLGDRFEQKELIAMALAFGSVIALVA